MSDHQPNFTATQHTEVTPAVDPLAVKLPLGFAVCILGANKGIGAGIARSYALAGASKLILTARNASALGDIIRECRKINPEIEIHAEACDLADNESMKALAGNIEATSNHHAAHYLLPILLRSDGAKAFLAVTSAAAWLTEGPIANAGYCISKLAQQRLIEMVAKQYESQQLLTVGIHPGAVATEMSHDAPDAFKEYLTDSVDLCGAICVWLTKETKATSWLNGRFISAAWDMEELAAREDEVVEKDLLKAAMRRS